MDDHGHLGKLAELDAVVRGGTLAACINRDEMRHVARIARIAERIAAGAPVTRLVLVSGPSSAGKTTTSVRLSNALRANGFNVCRLSTDDYFVGDARNPRKSDGTFDYETIEAVDVPRLGADLAALLAGAPVRLRRFDFERHDGTDAAEETILPAGGLVVLEGIHALNPRLVPNLPENACFRVYVNVFTCPLPGPASVFFPDDPRLLRRIVRDAAFRGTSASKTLAMWPDVCAGERLWIDPYRRWADAVFNTGLDYEWAVMKPFAEKGLAAVAQNDPGRREAERLLEILSHVTAAPPDAVPGDSLLREVIGGSTLDYV